MIIPRRLYRTADGKYCEEDDMRQAYVAGVPGETVPDAQAERTGLKAYLDETGWGAEAKAPQPLEAKAVSQTEVEDKAVAGPQDRKADAPEDTEDKGKLAPGLHIDPELRRGGRRV